MLPLGRPSSSTKASSAWVSTSTMALPIPTTSKASSEHGVLGCKKGAGGAPHGGSPRRPGHEAAERDPAAARSSWPRPAPQSACRGRQRRPGSRGMFASLAKAFEQLGDPRIRGVLIAAVLASLALLILLSMIASWFLLWGGDLLADWALSGDGEILAARPAGLVPGRRHLRGGRLRWFPALPRRRDHHVSFFLDRRGRRGRGPPLPGPAGGQGQPMGETSAAPWPSPRWPSR